MKTLRCVLFTLLTTCVTVAPVAAEESPLYAGLRVGSLSTDFPGFEDTAAIGLMFGYDLHTDPNGTLAVEAEITRTITDGDVSGGDGWDARGVGAYAAYRTAGDVYVKAKAGYLDQSINQGGGRTLNADDAGFAYGAGGGWRINSKAGLELEYTSMSDDLSFLSLAYVTHF
jgi:outer membrane immunogenic protein